MVAINFGRQLNVCRNIRAVYRLLFCHVAVAPYMAKMSSVYAVPLGVSMYIYYLVAF